jgi:plastocyanin
MSRIVFILLSVVLILMSGAAAEFTIFQRGRAFSTRQVAIQVGDEITFVNEDNVNHSLYSETEGAQFESLQRPGQSFTIRFIQPGVVQVRCTIHPDMLLEVQVRQ